MSIDRPILIGSGRVVTVDTPAGAVLALTIAPVLEGDTVAEVTAYSTTSQSCFGVPVEAITATLGGRDTVESALRSIGAVLDSGTPGEG